MISMWKVRSAEVAGTEFFEVYRITDAAREKDRVQTYDGYWVTEEEAAALADRLNTEGII